MNNLLIIDTAKIPKNPTTAHTRNAIELSKLLGCKLISTKEEIKKLEIKNFSVFIIVGSAFYPETAAVEAEIRKVNNPRIVWFNNEYQTSPNSEYLRLLKDFKGNSIIIANLAEDNNRIKHYSQYYDLNVNLLLYDKPNITVEKKYNICYYGSYRAKRRLYFQTYFTDNYIHVSSSTKNLKKFSQLAGGEANWCDKFSWEKGKETLNLFKYSLYIEDEYSHDNFTHLANRFYEALNCNVVQFFDINCRKTIEQSGIAFKEYYFVNSAKELKEKISKADFETSLKFQQQWNVQAQKERINLISTLKNILK